MAPGRGSHPPAAPQSLQPGGFLITFRTRRELFRDVGRGMIAAAVGPALAADLGFAFAADETGHINFGDLEPLVSFLQETPPDKLLPKVVEKMKTGTELKTFVA